MKSPFLLVALFFSLATAAFCQSTRMIDDIRSHSAGTAVWWAGHNSWIIKSGDLVLATDLWLEDGGRIAPAPITADELATEIDISFVTHAHSDHFNPHTSRVLLEKSSCIFVMPESCVEVAKTLGIPDNRLVVVKPRQPVEVMGVQVEPIRAIHGNANFAIYYEANLQDCGYVLQVGGKRFLQPGDSYLLEDHLFLKDIDVLFFSPTEHNMYIDRSIILINTLQPDYIFPQHHSTVKVNEGNRFWAKGYPEEVKIWIADELKSRYHIFEIGEKKLIE